MSNGINCVVLSGNLCNDGELRVLPGGDTVLKLRVAVNESWKKENGERQERTDFFSASIFGKRAEAIAKWTTKGAGVVIQGRLRTNKVGEGASCKWFTDIRISELAFTGGKGESKQRSMVDEPKEDGGGGSGSAPPKMPPDDESEIPFLRQDWPSD